MNCTLYRDDMMEYAIGTLPCDEAERISAHLVSGCRACEAALKEAQEVSAQLAYSLAPVPPPAALKNRVVQMLPPRTTREPAKILPAKTSVAFPNYRQSAWLPLAWAASLAAAVAITVGTMHEHQQRDLHELAQRVDKLKVIATELQERENAVTVLTTSLQQRDASIAELTNGIQQRENTIATLITVQERSEAANAEMMAQNTQLSSSLKMAHSTIDLLRMTNVRLASLAASGPQPAAARARVLWDKDSGRWQLIATGLIAPANGRMFELWFITTDERKVPAGTFTIDANGDAMMNVTEPHGIGDIAVVAVTDEPGFMPAPTGSINFAGKL